ncbi:MAG: hypothetical protein KGD59_11680 [Candidatus Heimdallarchaeota archaeon]|nr:hypothetical protein [Candidatus Heimdallarchaeota archaeon]MBY8995204.1 hypothetical protein [Candidatus Heimdallarchaeota archaeon]
MRGKKRYAMNLFIIAFIICSLGTSITTNEVDSVHYNFTLIAKTNGGGTRPDILNILKQQLVPLGINLEIIVQDWPTFVGEFINFRDFDLCYISLSGGGVDPDFTGVYDENGSLNLFGYHTSMDWDEEIGTGRNEWYIQTGSEMISNGSQNQKEFCWEWQFYLMDDILPCLPLFTHKNDSSSLQILIFNLREERPILGRQHPCPGYPSKPSNLAVKKAICYAINREEIRRVVFGVDYEITHHPVNPTNKSWLNPNIFKFCHNLQVGRAYMNVAGYGCGMPSNYGYDRWPDWEDVCGNNPTTISVEGFSLEIICISITLLSAVNLLCLTKRKRDA